MKVLGGKNLPPYWTCFDRMQRTAHKLRGRVGSPRGVFRFSSFAAFERWKREHCLFLEQKLVRRDPGSESN